MNAFDYVSFAASFFLFFAIRRWVATGESMWIIVLLLLCAPGWMNEAGMF